MTTVLSQFMPIISFCIFADYRLDLSPKRLEFGHMKDFILEVGKDFTFIGKEVRVQVGGEDYKIDLLFFSSWITVPCCI